MLHHIVIGDQDVVLLPCQRLQDRPTLKLDLCLEMGREHNVGLVHLRNWCSLHLSMFHMFHGLVPKVGAAKKKTEKYQNGSILRPDNPLAWGIPNNIARKEGTTTNLKYVARAPVATFSSLIPKWCHLVEFRAIQGLQTYGSSLMIPHKLS